MRHQEAIFAGFGGQESCLRASYLPMRVCRRPSCDLDPLIWSRNARWYGQLHGHLVRRRDRRAGHQSSSIGSSLQCAIDGEIRAARQAWRLTAGQFIAHRSQNGSRGPEGCLHPCQRYRDGTGKHSHRKHGVAEEPM